MLILNPILDPVFPLSQTPPLSAFPTHPTIYLPLPLRLPTPDPQNPPPTGQKTSKSLPTYPPHRTTPPFPFPKTPLP